MELTINDLLHGGLVFYGQHVVIHIESEDKTSKMERLEDQSEAIEKNYRVFFIDPKYCKETDTSYLLLVCE